MERKLKEISDRYADMLGGVSDHQMFQDIRALLGYVDQMHRQLMDHAAEEAVQAVFLSLEDEANHRVH
jgi:hypothetical protein